MALKLVIISDSSRGRDWLRNVLERPDLEIVGVYSSIASRPRFS